MASQLACPDEGDATAQLIQRRACRARVEPFRFRRYIVLVLGGDGTDDRIGLSGFGNAPPARPSGVRALRPLLPRAPSRPPDARTAHCRGSRQAFARSTRRDPTRQAFVRPAGFVGDLLGAGRLATASARLHRAREDRLRLGRGRRCGGLGRHRDGHSRSPLRGPRARWRPRARAR
jgi:hypothetical protein